MFSKNNKKMIIQKEQEKINYYGIKKFNVGTASVLIAAGFAFLGGGSALANNDTAVNATSEIANNNLVTANKEEVSTTTPVKVNKANLSAAIVRLQTAIANAGVTEKTASAIENAKAELATAKELEASEVATKAEVDKATVELKNKAFVLESMKKATAKEVDKPTEEKVNKNQDSRNGQAIPGKGESGFREASGTTSGTNYREKITALNAQLTTEIEKIKVEITKEESLGEGKKNKEKLDILKAIVNKAEEVKRNATNASTNNSETEQNLQAEWTKIKQEKDKLGYYLSRSENWGAPINNNKAGYGNNPANGVFENLKNGFGEMDFTGTSVESKSKTIEDQVNNLHSDIHYGKVTYHWKTKKITATDAENGMLNGWKIGGTKDYIHAVRPEEPTDYTLGAERTEKPKNAKAYDNNGKITTTTATQEQPNASGKFLGGLPTLDGMKNPDKGSVANRDYYLELGSKGVTLSKEYDVNPNSQLFFNLVHNGVYGKAALSNGGEEVKVEVTDAYTGKKIASVPMKNGQAPDTATNRPASSGYGTPADGWNNLSRLFAIPEGTSRVKITITANDDGQFKGVEDGFLIGGVGVATGPGMQLTSNVTSDGKTGEYGYSKDKLYKRSQEGKLNLELKNVGGMENTFPYGGTFNIKVKVPEGVELGTVSKTNYEKLDLSKASGESIWTDQGYLTNVRYDAATRTLSMNLNAVQYSKNNLQATGKTSRKFSIPFITKDDYVGDATFEVSGTGGFGGVDAEGNSLYSWKINGTGGMYSTEENYNSNGLRWSDNPDYYYNRTIYIDARKPKAPTVEEIHTDRIVGDKKDNNQEKYLLVSTGDTVGSLTPTEEQIKENILRVAKNNGVTLSENDLSDKVAEIKKNFELENEVGKKINITLPDNKKIELVKKADGWYRGDNKLELIDGKLKVTLADDINLHGLAGVDKIAVTATSPVGNGSDVANSNIVNDAPTVAVEKKDLYVYKTKEADKWNNDKVLEKAKPSATDLEDDRDGVDSTKPTIAVSDAGNLDTTKVGDYTVKVQSTDSEGKKSTEANVTVHVLDLITVDPTVTTDPTNPSTTAPVSPKTADTPVKEGDENLGKYPAGVTREDLVKEVTRTIKYLKEEDANKDNATPLYAEKVQKVTYKRTATVNPETKEVTYSDWEVYNEADKLTDAKADGTNGKYNSVESPVINNYLLVDNADKLVPEKDAPKPAQNGTVSPEVKKVLYKEIGSFVPNYPAGKKPQGAPDKISYPNNPNDPTVPGDFSTITIPYVPGYTPVYNGQELTPKNPNDPTQGYKVPDGFTPTDKFGESPITYTPSTQTAKVVIEKKVDGSANEVVSSFDLTGKSGSELPASTDIENKIKELKNQGYEVESDEYHIQDNHHPTFDDKEDINAQDGTPAPSQTFKIVVKPRIVEVPSSTPHEKDSPVDPNGENPELKWPEGLAESDLNTTAKRVISYVKKDSDTAPEEKVKDDTVQTVPFTRKATVNLVTKEVTYTDWESTNKTWDKVGVDVLPGYIADKKEIPAKEATTPAKDTKVIPDETDKVTYTKIGSWIPVDPTTGKDGEPIPFPNDPNDPMKTGEITQIIPHKDGYTPKDGNGTPLEPVNPANPEQGYKPPKITDPKANIKITYEKDAQKAKVKFVSVDPKTQTETELTDHALTLTGKSGEIIPESNVQAHIDVLKSMGYDIVDNPFDKDPVFDTKKDTNDNITQEFTIKVQPRVSTAKTVYVVEGDKPSAEKVGGAVTPGKNGKVTNPDVSNISTNGKAGQEIKVPVTVTYGADKFKRDEPVEVTVKVLPKPEPKGVTVLNGTLNEKLIDTIRANVKKAIDGLTNVPEGVTPFVTDDAIVTPKTDKNGQQTPVTVTVKYRDNATGKVIDDIFVNVEVPVNVVGSTPASKVVFEGDELTAKDITDAVTPGENGTKGEPKDLAKDITAKPGVKEVTVPVTYTDQNGETLTEPVKVKVTVLPKPTPKGIFVAKDSDKEKAKEKALAKVKEAIAEGTFKGKLPANVTNVSIDENVTSPDLSDDTDVNVTVKYTVDEEEKTTTVKVPVTVVEGVPQIVPVDENNKQPNPENSIDKTEYPEGSTFEYDPNTPVNTTTPGDYKVNVIVKDKEGNSIAEVPAIVRVVESYPQFVPVDKDKKQPSAEGSIDPKAFPKDTEFTYETPVDTTTPGEKDVIVVAKIGDKVITKVPAKVMVVEAKTQYVPVDKSNKQPDASKSIDPEQYPDKITFGYKTPVDTTTPGEKDVVVVAKDGEDKLVEVPAKVKVVEGKEQLIPINATGENQPKPKDSITPSDYPEDSTFEYKVPEGQTTPYDGTTSGDKPVTVVVKDKNGNVLVEVPATIKVVESKPTPIETPVTKTPLTQEDYTKGIKIPEEARVEVVGGLPDLTTPGEKTPVEVKITLKNGKSYTVKVPVNVTPVKEIETPVTKTPLTPEDYTKGIKIPEGGKVTNVENIPDLTTPGKKDPVKVTVELPNGKVVTVEVPVNVTPVKEIETPVTNTPLTPEDYTKGIKIPEGGKVTNVENIPDLTTPGKKDPVKVTITLPNGKVVTVEVPVNVTPITPIDTPVTKDKLTPEDILKQIKVPEGATVTVGDRPDLTTPGKKDPVKVTITLPNGKVVTVEVPVNVTPIKDIVKKQGDPITAEDVENHIPKGAKVISIGDKPTTDVPGVRPSIPVVIELPNGIRVTMDIPVIVTPKVTPVVVPVGTPVTPEDVQKHIELPKGWKVTKVGEIPTTTTPGTKPVVSVEIQLPDGRKITVDVPVIVTPTVRQIVVPQGTPITPDDVINHIDLPKEPGWEIVEVGEIPITIPAGVKPSVKVKVKIPSGEIVEVDVPVLVIPKGRPIVVEVGTPITKEDVIKQIDLPEGWEIVEVGEIPTTETPGQKPSVKVKVKVPSGEIIEIEVPVTVTQKGVPTTPSTPTSPTRTENQKEPVAKDGVKVLPNTGINDSSSPLAGLGLAILGLATVVRRRKEK